MPVFLYTAQASNGRKVNGRLEAHDKASALDALLVSGQTPLSLEAQKEAGDWRAWFQSRRKDLSVSDVGVFSLDLSRLISSGFSLVQALNMVAVSTESKPAKALSIRAAEHVQKGGRLSEVIAKETGGPAQALAGLVQAGEAAGALETVLEDAAKSFQASAAFKERLGSALIYPAIILFMISLTLIVFFSFVLPRLQPLFEGAGDNLPMATRGLLAFGRFCELGLPLILIAALAGFLAVQLLPALKARLALGVHGLMLTPIGLGAPRLAGYALYARTLGLLLTTGVPLPVASETAAGSVGNKRLAVDLGSLTPALREGRSLSSALPKASKPPEVLLRMCYVGEQSGKLGAALIDAASLLERKARTRTDRLLSALTPAITIILGLIVALVVGALFLGIASLTEVDF